MPETVAAYGHNEPATSRIELGGHDRAALQVQPLRRRLLRRDTPCRERYTYWVGEADGRQVVGAFARRKRRWTTSHS
jgi:hypothetical protein